MSRRRRRILLGTLIAVPFVVVGVACSFPEVTFDDGVEAGVEGSTSSSSGSSLVDGGGKDGPIQELKPDAAQRPDGEGPVSAGSCADATPCDCDGDGYLRSDCPDDAGADANMPGGDCDDLDPIRHPGAGAKPYPWDAAQPGVEGDWNCDGKGERTPKLINCPPAKAIPIVGGKCPGADDGFITDPDELNCGYSADIYHCPTTEGILTDLNCDPVPTGNQATVNCQ